MIRPQRLLSVRKRRGFSREILADKARLTAKTIYRLEKGDEPKPIRQANLERLAQALGVDPDILTEEESDTIEVDELPSPVEGTFYHLHVRVDGTVRNAFELLARRYRVSLSTIVEFAPLLFDLMAGASLKYRSKKLDEFEATLHSLKEIGESFPHLAPTIFCATSDQEAALRAEELSIANRDIFGLQVPHRQSTSTTGPNGWPRFSAWDEEHENPLVVYLRTLTAERDIAIAAAGPGWTDYEVGRSEARELAGGDEEITDWILRGEIPLQRIPRDLNTCAERIEWMRQNRIQVEQ